MLSMQSSRGAFHPRKRPVAKRTAVKRGRQGLYYDEDCSFVKKYECYCQAIENFYSLGDQLPCQKLRKLEKNSKMDDQNRLLEIYGVPYVNPDTTTQELSKLYVGCPFTDC